MALLRAAPLVALALALTAGRATGEEEREYAVKAAFVYNFARFVTWPAEVLAPEEPFVVCVVGNNPFGDKLQRAVRAKKVHGRDVVIRRHPAASDWLEACHLAFVAASPGAGVEGLLAAATARHVLTVGEGADFIARGGAIAMVLDGGHVRFQLNLKAVRAAGLAASAQLIEVASRVVE